MEANYLGFLALRDAGSGELRRRWFAQTALVETVRFEPRTGFLLLVGAGFEGTRDAGVVKVIDPATGGRVAELRGHRDDATDVLALSGDRRRIVSVGLDRQVLVFDLHDPAASPEPEWAWSGYEDYLNTCAERPGHPGELAVAGDSPFTYVLDANRRAVVAKLDTPGDSNGLMWSADGRYLLVADDHGQVLAFDGDARWKLTGEAKVGGAAKRMVVDEADPERALVACYDGRVWSIPRALPERGAARAPFVVVDRRRGMWGINVAATADRIAVPSFFDRACLLARDGSGAAAGDVGPEPEATFGCNWLALHPSRREMAVTHDDARIRVRDLETGALLRVIGPDTSSLCMGAAFHPTLPLLGTVDFYGELLVYDYESGRVVWRRDLDLGPGISVDFSPCGRFLATGGYNWRGRLLRLGPDGLPAAVDVLDAPNRGVIKSIAFASGERLLAVTGDGLLVVHDRDGDGFRATKVIRGEPRMELCNGVAVSPDGRVAYVVSRDQTLRAFDVESGAAIGTAFGHVRGVKTVHASECGRFAATGSYDRTVMIWSARDLDARLPPVRLANSGISGVRCRGGRVYACSFDGVIFAVDASTGRLVWHVTAAETSEGR